MFRVNLFDVFGYQDVLVENIQITHCRVEDEQDCYITANNQVISYCEQFQRNSIIFYFDLFNLTDTKIHKKVHLPTNQIDVLQLKSEKKFHRRSVITWKTTTSEETFPLKYFKDQKGYWKRKTAWLVFFFY
jgi:hypothetical protein